MSVSGNKRKRAEESTECPYLDTIERSLLDFDFEPMCSASLEVSPHIYCCLVCGKYFRGRSRSTPAYTHSVEESHFVFLHLSQGTFWCLPDDYEIRDASLADISAALHPTFSREQIRVVDSNTDLSRDLFGRKYLPGFVGLNNLGKTDGVNAIVQALAHVPPLRDYFLNQSEIGVQIKLDSPHHRTAQTVTRQFGALVRNLWSSKRFKSHVDPHRFVHAVAAGSKFAIGQQVEAGEFMAWMLNQLHVGTGGGRKAGSSIVHRVFQGEVQVTTRQAKKVIRTSSQRESDDRGGSDAEDEEMGEENEKEESKLVVEETTVDSNFLQLTLDIPEKPLFRDEDGGLVIPQEPLVGVLKKFDGVSFADAISRSGEIQRKRYVLRKLPEYLILCLTRFKKNQYNREKNPSIVMFPVKNLDLSPYVKREDVSPPPTERDIQSMSIKQLKKVLIKYGRKDLADSAVEKADLLDATLNLVSRSMPDVLADKYDLVANITHESPAEVGREGTYDPLQVGSYKCHVQHRGTKQWYEIQDMHVREMMPQQIGLSESYLLIFERKSAQQRMLVVN